MKIETDAYGEIELKLSAAVDSLQFAHWIIYDSAPDKFRGAVATMRRRVLDCQTVRMTLTRPMQLCAVSYIVSASVVLGETVVVSWSGLRSGASSVVYLSTAAQAKLKANDDLNRVVVELARAHFDALKTDKLHEVAASVLEKATALRRVVVAMMEPFAEELQLLAESS